MVVSFGTNLLLLPLLLSWLPFLLRLFLPFDRPPVVVTVAGTGDGAGAGAGAELILITNSRRRILGCRSRTVYASSHVRSVLRFCSWV